MFRNGSEAAKAGLIERMAAFSQEAELNRACPSVLICFQFGQLRLLADIKTPPKKAGFSIGHGIFRLST
jgi:hypothetical protein